MRPKDSFRLVPGVKGNRKGQGLGPSGPEQVANRNGRNVFKEERGLDDLPFPRDNLDSALTPGERKQKRKPKKGFFSLGVAFFLGLEQLATAIKEKAKEEEEDAGSTRGPGEPIGRERAEN